MNLNPIMGALLESADALSQASGDYINPADGLKYCVKCRTPKEAFFPENLLLHAGITVQGSRRCNPFLWL